MLEQLHLVKLIAGLGEDEAAPGHDVPGGEADHGQCLLVVKAGHTRLRRLGRPGWMVETILGHQLRPDAEAADHKQQEGAECGDPLASVKLFPDKGCYNQHCSKSFSQSCHH